MWEKKRILLPFHRGLNDFFHPEREAIVQTRNFFRLDASFVEHTPKPAMKSNGVSVAFVPSCPVDDSLPMLSWLDGMLRYIPYRYPHYYLDTEGTFEEYVQKTLSKNNRKKHRRRKKKFEELGDGKLHWKEFKNLEGLALFYQESRRLSSMSYQEQWLGLGFPATDEFREELWNLAKKNEMRGYLLYHQEKAVAFLFGSILDRDILWMRYGAYHPDFKEYSIGYLLDFVAMEQAFLDTQIRTIDLSMGEGEHKKRFATGKKECADVYFMEPTLQNLSFAGAHWTYLQAENMARKVLQRYDLESKVRSWLRKEGSSTVD